jgi:hypothetical protein
MATAVSPARPVARAPAETDAIVTLLRELVAGQADLSAKLDTLLSRLPPGPRDDADEALIRVIASVAGDLPFTAAALWRRRAVNLALASALENSDLDSPKQIGRMLRRCEGCDVDGVRILRVGATREGLVWRASLQE